MLRDPNDIDAMVAEWQRQLGIAQADPAAAARDIKARCDRINRNRTNLAVFAVAMSLLGWALFVTAPVGVIMGLYLSRNRTTPPRTSDRLCSWAIFLGVVPIGIVLTVIIERLVIRHH